mmetsp:Transcript_64464/g.76353  ORF Transcript_64464/g.76353 Transcript_64464/m.76353 type:complete len:427 (+) Transcript_64464:94-1374(+)|eukprot:CAMPEP_0172506652 /NCGR_PEP_ID=MMETSP1066-20121228/196981_1 /TAXON_ID=671091 /ORGANISM="Coscinodiscus wailesii, Strain CCMP2513" /LENGTH=426 /DNA_ID=CAMNT_0013283773 /DNA_START=85 /DNA_END=1365 /DNA_ORIENTATION=+
MSSQLLYGGTTDQRLPHIDGLKFLGVFWFLMTTNFTYSDHVEDDEALHATIHERLCRRSYVAIQLFIVMSGFISHYGYNGRDFSNMAVTKKYFINRFLSILACYYASVFVSHCVKSYAQCQTFWCGHKKVNEWLAVFAILTLTQSWFGRHYAFWRNTKAFILSTVAFSWVTYPFMKSPLQRLSDKALKISLIVVPIFALIPVTITLIVKGGMLQGNDWYWFYLFPLSRFPDFVFGVLLSELFIRGNDKPVVLPKLADAAALFIMIIIMSVPFAGRESVFDSLMIFLPMPLVGLVLYGTSCDPTGSLLGRFCSLEVCKRLGEFSFEVYMWSDAVQRIVVLIEFGAEENVKGLYLTPWYLLLMLIMLYPFSYAWYRYVDAPLRNYVYTSIPRGTGASPTKDDPTVDEKEMVKVEAGNSYKAPAVPESS